MRLGSHFHAAAKRFYAQFRRGLIARPATLLKRRDFKVLSGDSVAELRNALVLLRDHCWERHEVVSIEVPFFMDLAAGLPPVIGVPDLVLRRHDWLVLVDHKTSRSLTTATLRSWCSTASTSDANTPMIVSLACSMSIGWCETSARSVNPPSAAPLFPWTIRFSRP